MPGGPRNSIGGVESAVGLQDVSAKGLTSRVTNSGKASLADDEYDPHQNRVNESATTNTETLVHLLKGSLGTGILAMPNAFAHAGLVNGFIGTLLFGSLCTYCLHILIGCQYKLCKQMRVPCLTYPKSMKVALLRGPRCLHWFAHYSQVVVNVFLIAYQMGICCVYIVFVASNIQVFFNNFVEERDIRFYMVVLLPFFVLLNYIKNLKLLAPFSTLANLITFVCLGIIFWYVFQDMPALSERKYVAPFVEFPLFFGTTLFALEAVGVIIAIENNMKTPGSFVGLTGVLNRGMTVIVALYVIVGFFGYIKYGSEAKGTITLNLPQGDPLAQSVILMLAIAIYITYALQCYVPIHIIWEEHLKSRFINSSKRKSMIYEYLIRTGVVIVTFLLAVAIPRLELFISLIGAMCLSALGIAFPGLIELCTLWPDNLGKCKWILIKDLLLIAFGILAFFIGTYVSIMEIIHSFQ